MGMMIQRTWPFVFLQPCPISLTNIHITVINRNGTTSELISLGIFDDTADASLILYGGLADSASVFKVSYSVLLISNPGWRIEKTAKLFINGNSRLDIDPDFGDARRLRALAQRLTKKEHVNPPFLCSLSEDEVRGWKDATVKALYTLADVDDFVRSNPTEQIVGYLSVILTRLDIVTPFKRNMLMSNECCGIPIFANRAKVVCKQCEESVMLRINPRIVSQLFHFVSTPFLADVLTARSHPRRNRHHRQRQTRPFRYRMGTATRSQRGPACRYQSRHAEVSGAEAVDAEGYDGVCVGWGGGDWEVRGLVCRELAGGRVRRRASSRNVASEYDQIVCVILVL